MVTLCYIMQVYFMSNYNIFQHEIIVEKRKVSFSSVIKRLKYSDIDIGAIGELLENEHDFEKQIEMLVDALTINKERVSFINLSITC